MATIHTKHHGALTYDEGSALRFAAGLLGFEDQREFVAIEEPRLSPIVFLQSATTADLCFITLPILVVDPNYRLSLPAEHLEALGFRGPEQPRIGTDVMCLAVIVTHPGEPATANLLAPIVINLRTMNGLQAISTEAYSHQQPLPTRNEEPVCS